MSLRATFPTQLSSQWSLKPAKALSLRLNRCFGLFTMTPVERSSQTGVFRHLSKHVFRGRQFRKCITYEGHLFFWKCSKFNANSKNEEKKVCFWDKCIWIVCIHLSLLLREYVSLAVNVLRKGLKNFHVSKSDFYNSITSTVITWAGKSALIKIESVFRTVYHVACQEYSQTGAFRHLSKHVFRCR